MRSPLCSPTYVRSVALSMVDGETMQHSDVDLVADVILSFGHWLDAALRSEARDDASRRLSEELDSATG